MAGPNVTAKVRAARASDLATLVAIEQHSFSSDQLSRRSLRRFLTRPTCDIWIVEMDQLAAGYALVLHRTNSTMARLYSIAVLSDYRGMGLAGKLLRACEAGALRRGKNRLCLEVRTDNPRALELYDRAGYEPMDDLPTYYADGCDGLRLCKPLTQRL
ncbi:MAG: N-acetyltransferase [Xanthomonadales bacterium]|nr:N-acetyltransferase [Xanthomonadales bacterium]